MEKLFDVVIDGQSMSFFGEFEKDTIFDLKKVDIQSDKKIPATFGETFAGHKMDKFDVAEKIIQQYINECLPIHIDNVANEIEDFKQANQEYVPVGYPTKFFHNEKKFIPLNAYTDTTAYYGDGDSFYVIADGNILTDYEEFFKSALVQDYEEGHVVFLNGYEGLEEYAKEMSEESNM